MGNVNKKISPTLIAFGNVLLDCSFSTDDRDDIFHKFNLKPNDLGECSVEQLKEMQSDASNT